MEQGIIKSETELAATTFDSFKSVEDMVAFASTIVKSRLSPLKTPEDVVAAILTGKEIGLPVMASITNIYPIEGKPSLGIHVMSALAIKAGIITEVLRDYEPIFQLALIVDKDDSTKEFVTIGTCFLDEPLKEGTKRGKTIIDYKTVIRFTRKVKQPDNTYSIMTVTQSFSIKDAETAGLMNKSNWKNHPKTMVRTRALALGYRLIGDDIFMGMYETSELADSSNMNYNVTEDAKITIIEPQKPQNNTQNHSSALGEEVIAVEEVK